MVITIPDTAQRDILMRILKDEGFDGGLTFSGDYPAGKGQILACGITADITDGGEGEELPCFLRPVGHVIMDASELQDYSDELRESGFTAREAEYTVRVVKKYMLPEPMPEFFIDGKFRHEIMAEYLRKKNRIVMINGQLHVYRGNYYQPSTTALENEIIQLVPTSRDTQRREVIKYLQVVCYDDEIKLADPRYICFANGIYDVITGKLLPHTPELIIPNMIPWAYNPDAYSADADCMLDRLSSHETDVRRVLEEVVGYCFYRNSKLRTYIMLTGPKANGKSTYMSLIGHVLSKKNCAYLSANEFSDKFGPVGLVGKLANLGDDIESQQIANEGVIKKLSAGSEMKVEQKGEKQFSFENFATLIFSCNTIPRAKDDTDALLSRMLIVPLHNTFAKGSPDYDPWILSRLETREVAEYLIKVGIEGLKRILINKSFSTCAATEKELAKYKVQNHPELDFLREIDSDIAGYTTQKVYDMYRQYCQDSGLKPMGKTRFKASIEQNTAMRVVTRCGARIWVSPAPRDVDMGFGV